MNDKDKFHIKHRPMFPIEEVYQSNAETKYRIMRVTKVLWFFTSIKPYPQAYTRFGEPRTLWYNSLDDVELEIAEILDSMYYSSTRTSKLI